MGVFFCRPLCAARRAHRANVKTAFGWIAVAVTQRSVAAIELADKRDAACARIVERFAAADLTEDGVELREILAALLRYIERPAAGLDLPLDVQGTVFARRVWRALTQFEAR